MRINDVQIRAEAPACDARKLEQARRMTPAERFLAGAELFEEACEVTLAGIRHQYPHWTEGSIVRNCGIGLQKQNHFVMTSNESLRELFKVYWVRVRAI